MMNTSDPAPPPSTNPDNKIPYPEFLGDVKSLLENSPHLAAFQISDARLRSWLATSKGSVR